MLVILVILFIDKMIWVDLRSQHLLIIVSFFFLSFHAAHESFILCKTLYFKIIFRFRVQLAQVLEILRPKTHGTPLSHFSIGPQILPNKSWRIFWIWFESTEVHSRVHVEEEMGVTKNGMSFQYRCRLFIKLGLPFEWLEFWVIKAKGAL